MAAARGMCGEWGMGIADCRYAGSQLVHAVDCLAARTDNVAHDCRSDAEIAVMQTVDTIHCMSVHDLLQCRPKCRRRNRSGDCQFVLSRQC